MTEPEDEDFDYLTETLADMDEDFDKPGSDDVD